MIDYSGVPKDAGLAGTGAVQWLRSVRRFTSLDRRVPGFVSDEGIRRRLT